MKAIRRIQIKVWPELISDFPAIIPLERVPRNKLNPIDIDFTNVIDGNSSGLTILLITLIKLVSHTENNWDGLAPTDKIIHERFKALNFYNILLKNIPNYNLFWQDFQNKHANSIAYDCEKGQTLSYPIYELDFDSSNNRRDGVDEFKKHLTRQLFYLHEKYDFELSIFIQILVEIAKNSADHTDSNGYFGLDIVTYNNKAILKFSFGDLGRGINNQIRDYIRNDPNYQDKASHLALTDSYQYALKVGNSTKHHSGINKGIGMSTIFNLSKQLQLKLSVFDAESRGLLTKATEATHAELRRIFYNIGFKVGFYYFGELEINLT